MKYRVCIEEWNKLYYFVEGENEAEAEEAAWQARRAGMPDFEEEGVHLLSIDEIPEPAV